MTKHAAAERARPIHPSICCSAKAIARSFVSLSSKSASDGRMQNLRARSVGRSGNRWEEYERGGERWMRGGGGFSRNAPWKAVHRPAASNAATASPRISRPNEINVPSSLSLRRNTTPRNIIATPRHDQLLDRISLGQIARSVVLRFKSPLRQTDAALRRRPVVSP